MKAPARRGCSFIVLLCLLSLQPSCRETSAGAVTDDLNRPVAIPSDVRRVVTLAPGLSEIVHAIGSSSKLVGTDDFSDFPPEVAALPKVGGMEPSRERIAELAPDLVLASTSSMHPQLASALGSMNVSLFAVRTDRLHEIGPAMTKLGGILGSPAAAEARSEFERSLEAQRRKRSRAPRVLFVIWAEPLYVAVPGTHLGDLLEWTGVVNAAASASPQSLYSLESVLENPPDVILYPSEMDPPAALLSMVNTEERARQVVAYPVDEDLFMRPGPRVALAAAEVNRIADEWEKAQ